MADDLQSKNPSGNNPVDSVYPDDSSEQSINGDMSRDISRLKGVVGRLQNFSAVGVGSTMPALTRSGIVVPPVKSISISFVAGVLGNTRVTVTWIEPDTRLVDRYNIYTVNAFSGQTKEVLTASSRQSPAVFDITTTTSASIKIIVQTVLRNGQVNSIESCPTSSFTAPAGNGVSITGDITTTGGIAVGTPVVTTGVVNVGVGFRISNLAPAGTVLRGNGTNYVSSVATLADAYSVNDLLYAGTANTVSGLATSTSALLVTDGSGVPSWSNTVPAHTVSTFILVPIVSGGNGASSTLQLVGTVNGTPSNAHVLLNPASQGFVGIGTTAPTSVLHVVGLPVYANNAAAVTGGLTPGALYRTGGNPDPVCVVH